MTPLRQDGIHHRPRPAALHVAGALTPTAAMASKVALQRDVPQRVQRLRDALKDAFEQRRRPTRERMRALTVGPGGRFSWRDVPAPPPPGPDGAIVHPIAMATCDLDRLLALGATPFILPLHFGHECVAEVLAVGENVAAVGPGDRVVVPFQISCGACRACLAGFTGNCEKVPPISMYGFGVGGGHWGGAVSDQLAVPFADAMLVPLPDGTDPADAASVADNVCDGYRHVAPYADELLARDPDAEMLIVAGIRRRPAVSASITLYAGLVARALGLRAVHLVESRAHVRAHAERLGLVVHRPSELRRLPLFPLVMDASGTPSGLAAALNHTAEEGICSSAGSVHRTARIPSGLMFGRNVTCRIARSHARAIIPHVLELMQDGRLSPELVTTDVAPIDEAPQAIRRHVLGDATKTVLVA
jgi:alcohol dehydrogenase